MPRDAPSGLDLELEHLPAELRWREWMARVEAAVFAAADPVPRETLARLVGRGCPLDRLVDDIRAELRRRPYDLVRIAGGYTLRTRARHAAVIRAAFAIDAAVRSLSKLEAGVLTAIAYEQPVTRAALSEIFGREISRDLIASLRDKALIAAGPRKPEPGAPVAYVTTPAFLSAFGLPSLSDLPDLEALKDAGLAVGSGKAGDPNPAFGALPRMAPVGGPRTFEGDDADDKNV